MHTVLRDVQYAVRQLRRAPGFTITAVLTLALGLGATTAIFSLIYSTMLKTMPVEHAAKLYFIGPEPTCCNWGGMQEDKWALFSYDQYRYFRDHTSGFESLAAFEAGRTALLTRRVGDPRAPETVKGRFVSGNEFSTFGVPVALGRPILPTDDMDAASPVAVLSYRAWDRRYGKDPGVLNASFTMDGVVVTVVGITAPEYKGEIVQSDPPEAWLPLHQAAKFDGSTGASARINRLHSGWLDLVGRVAPGASPEALQSQVIVELRQWLHAHASEFAPPERAQIDRQTTRLISARTGVNEIGDEYGQGLKLLMAAACFVLLIVCANVANLLLVRATAERQTMAVRIALGASRAQLLRQALVASALLSLAGSAGALLIAYTVAHSVLGLAFRGAQYVPVDVHLSLPVLAFAMLVALLTSLLFGVGPALIATRTDPASAIRGTARTTKDTNSTPQRVLVVLQAALSVVLLCAAGLLLRSLNNLQKQDFGFQTADRYILGIDPFLAGYKPDQLDDLYRKLHARLMAIPGAGAAGLALYTPMAHNNWAEGVFLPGQPDPQPGNLWYIASWTRVNPDYFTAIGTRLRSGRFITDADDANSRKVAVVNQTFANRYFKGSSALGQHFGLEPERRSQFEIVGVVEDTKYQSPDQPAPPMYFLPFAQRIEYAKPEFGATEGFSRYAGQVALYLPNSSPATAEAAARRAFADVDPNLTLADFTTFKDQVATNFNQNELLARLTSLFGIVALILASVGIYGVTAYSVERRTGEIGVRMALGADRRRILQDVLHHALVQCGIGLALGVPMAYAVGRMLGQHLYGVSAFDPPVDGITLLTLLLAAVVAAFFPARRAASIEPMMALRLE